MYISFACPWACRCLAVLGIKGISRDVVSVSVVGRRFEPTKPGVAGDTHTGWVFKTAEEEDGCIPDPRGRATARAIYEETGAATSRFTVPILFDLETDTIVSNESSEIIEMLNSQFNPWATRAAIDLSPPTSLAAQDSVNEWIYHDINNGVYKAGFARSQEAYTAAATTLFAALDKAEGILAGQRFLAGEELTLADIRLFVTLIRFDPVYVVHFKCSKKAIREYPALHGFMLDVLGAPGVRETVHWGHIRDHYFQSHESVNPHRIVALAPSIDYDAPHGRDVAFPGTARFGALGEEGEGVAGASA